MSKKPKPSVKFRRYHSKAWSKVFCEYKPAKNTVGSHHEFRTVNDFSYGISKEVQFRVRRCDITNPEETLQIEVCITESETKGKMRSRQTVASFCLPSEMVDSFVSAVSTPPTE